MPCPFFAPIAPRTETEWFRPPRSPLGVLYAGECRAGREALAAEDDRCNFGYARGQCPRFPENAAFDAVRFSWSASEVLYVLERDNRPVEYGTVREACEQHPLLSEQAEAFRRTAPNQTR